jgi:hypothetical protein
MIISKPKKFIFLASPKSGSTTVEIFLRRYASVGFFGSDLGKHSSCTQIRNNLNFLFKEPNMAYEDYFSFGVVRHPVSRLVSWYNYLQRPGVRPSRSTAGISFREYALKILEVPNKAQEQLNFFSFQGNLSVDYLIPSENLNTSLIEFCDLFKLKISFNPSIHSENVSIKKFFISDIDSDLLVALTDFYSDDINLYLRACNGSFGSMADAAKKTSIF